MDWGLLDKNAGENKLLREEIVYAYKVSSDLLSIEQNYFFNVSLCPWDRVLDIMIYEKSCILLLNYGFDFGKH